MELLLDLGNTRLKWAWWDGAGLTPSQAAVHHGATLPVLLDTVWHDVARPERVHLASVADADRREALTRWVESQWQCPVVLYTSPAQASGLQNAYVDPARLGIDRWLAMQGAWRHGQTAACVVDCGSAITIDILDATGRHLGGWIAPGLHLMRAALTEGTALDGVAGDGDTAFGCDTTTAIRNGTLQALAGLIEQAMAQLTTSARLVMTGGDAQLVARALNTKCEIYPDLVLEGLAGMLKGA